MIQLMSFAKVRDSTGSKRSWRMATYAEPHEGRPWAVIARSTHRGGSYKDDRAGGFVADDAFAGEDKRQT